MTTERITVIDRPLKTLTIITCGDGALGRRGCHASSGGAVQEGATVPCSRKPGRGPTPAWTVPLHGENCLLRPWRLRRGRTSGSHPIHPRDRVICRDIEKGKGEKTDMGATSVERQSGDEDNIGGVEMRGRGIAIGANACGPKPKGSRHRSMHTRQTASLVR